MILSIVMPAFNAAEHMEDALRSVAPLLRAGAELIFVNDGSTDDSALKFKQLQAAIPLSNSQLLEQTHAGVSVARNTGLAAARGDYVLFVDSDDWVSPELIDEIRGVMGGRTIDVVCWGWDTVGPGGDVKRRYFDVHPVLPVEMTGVEALRCRTIDRSLRLWTSSAAYRRSYLLNAAVRFSPGCAVGEDLEFGYRALLHAANVSFLPKVLAVYRKRSASASSSPSVDRFGSVLALRRVLQELEADGRPELTVIIEHFRRSKELVNYFHTLEECLHARRAASSADILREIEERFPGLNAEVCRAVQAFPSGAPFEWRLFATAPRLWWAWVRARRWSDRFLPERLRSSGPLADRRRASLLAR